MLSPGGLLCGKRAGEEIDLLTNANAFYWFKSREEEAPSHFSIDKLIRLFGPFCQDSWSEDEGRHRGPIGTASSQKEDCGAMIFRRNIKHSSRKGGPTTHKLNDFSLEALHPKTQQ